MDFPTDPALPLWLKLGYSAFVAILVPVYLKYWGPGNFLWFSDLALFTTFFALWLESSLLASMMALAVLLPELVWNADFFTRLARGRKQGGLAGYMFDGTKPLFVRGLSLFHVFLPVLLIWLIYTLGYARQAWLAQSAVAWVVLLLTYLVTDREQNVNWVHGPTSKPQTRISPRLYLLIVMIVFPLGIYLPTHLILRAVFA